MVEVTQVYSKWDAIKFLPSAVQIICRGADLDHMQWCASTVKKEMWRLTDRHISPIWRYTQYGGTLKLVSLRHMTIIDEQV